MQENPIPGILLCLGSHTIPQNYSGKHNINKKLPSIPRKNSAIPSVMGNMSKVHIMSNVLTIIHKEALATNMIKMGLNYLILKRWVSGLHLKLLNYFLYLTGKIAYRPDFKY